ncbi:MFS transporter [Bradyrhizobium macuxiense]|uniref:MFS transporter n=1 Tax=Bradyrhizobium macuxiense TaxID=1755647 RepID=UPI0011BF921D
MPEIGYGARCRGAQQRLQLSYNAARCIGPAIGGIMVATAGAVATFALSRCSPSLSSRP